MPPTTPPFMHEQHLAMLKYEAAGLEILGPCPPHLHETSITIPLTANRSNTTKIIFPRPSPEQHKPLHCPLIIYFHGGGLSTCTPDQVLAPARGFAIALSCIVACPALNQLPFEPFPGPVKMAWEVCAWLSNPQNLNDGVLGEASAVFDPSRGIVVGGLSSGGAVAAVLGTVSGCITAGLEEFARLPSLQSPITGIFSGLPFLVTEGMIPSEYCQLFKSRDLASDDTLRLELEARLDVHSPWFSPLNVRLDQVNCGTFQHHPRKVFTYGGETDQFRDDAIIYGNWLSKLPGVQSRTVILENEGHTAWVTPPWSASHSRRIKQVTLDGMAWVLGLKYDKRLLDSLV
ncbi:alpha/beta-hydrolase [Aspergillus stella-maris]|uniref:alpha/beta-hydrolase n=1 Tax=Aspergillus stella-maris TaxID=1810926 RepID=UPI003CCDD354